MDITITIFDKEKYEGKDWPERAAVSYIKWFAGKTNEAPHEYRDSVEIKLSSVGGYDGDHDASIRITYKRPETQKETQLRLDRERVREDSVKKRELADLQRLKSKYGG